MANNTAPYFGSPSIAGGKLRVDIHGGGTDYAESLVVQPDGKLIVVGYSERASTPSESGYPRDFSLIRVNADGTLDTNFGTGGKLRIDVGGEDSAIGAVLQADGKIVVAGYSEGKTGIFSRDFSLIRLNANGTLDTSFGTGGKLVVPLGDRTGDTATSVALQADGKIVVTGSSRAPIDAPSPGTFFALIRVNTDGTLDSSLGTGGKLVLPGIGSANSVAVQADGKLVVAGARTGSDGLADFSVTRFNVDGSLDTSFNGTGQQTASFVGSSIDVGNSVVLQSDGKVIVAGPTRGGRSDALLYNDFGLIRLNVDGTLDTGFGSAGKVIVPIGKGDVEDYPESVVVQPDGKIIVAGTSASGHSDFSLVRLNADGTLDTGFGAGGKVIVPIGYYDTFGYHDYDDTGRSVVIQADGKIVVAGSSSDVNRNDFALIRLNPDGSLDTSFNAPVQPPSTLDAVATYTGNPGVVLDASVAIYDAELAAQGHYAGATLTLARLGGAHADDLFGGFVTTANATFFDTPGVGSFTQSGGTLVITFDNKATQGNVNAILGKLTYQNLGTQPPASVQIAWTFSDGNTGAQGMGGARTATGITTGNIVNTGPTISGIPSSAQSITAGTAVALADFTVANTNGDALIVDLKASGGSIGGITKGVTGGVTVSPLSNGWKLQGSAAAINALVADATFTARGIGTPSIEVTVHDGRVTTPVSATYAFIASNTVPIIKGLPLEKQAIQVGTPAELADFTFADADGQVLSVRLLANNGTIGGITKGTAGGVTVTGGSTDWRLKGDAAAINALVAGANFSASVGGVASITVTVDDDYVTTPVSATYAFVVSRPANANTAPTISGIPATAQAVQVGKKSDLANFKVADADGDNLLTVTLVASNGDIGNLRSQAGQYTFQGSASEINQWLANATFTASAAGPASIAISVSDGTAAPVNAAYRFTATGQTQPPDPSDQFLTGTSGNDLLQGTPGNDRIDGLGGIDRVLANGSRATHSLTHNADSSWQLASTAGDSDQLINVERVLFSDGAVALDLDGNAGAAARLLGLLSSPALHDPDLAGVVLGLVDSLGLEGAARVAVDSGVVAQLAGGGSQQQLLGYLYAELFGQAPGQPELQALMALAQGLGLDNAQVLAAIASTDLTAEHIGLVGLAQQGLGFTEFPG